jgi:predicted Rossmann fold flavoprotein
VLTGSTGDGYRFAKECGHSIVETSPSLVPFSIAEKWCYELQGLSLRNVKATVTVDGKQIYSDFGEMLFTHYGVSGPLILSASSYYVHNISKPDVNNKDVKLYIDLKPALTYEQLDKRILREFDDNKNKQFKNVISSLFPSKLVPVMPMLADISPDRKVNEVTREERERFVNVIKNMELTITGTRDYNEAIITKGGISTNEISPSTMESKLVKGLYFAGEVLDLDALTGGFNLQIAWSTGYLAGQSAVVD